MQVFHRQRGFSHLIFFFIFLILCPGKSLLCYSYLLHPKKTCTGFSFFKFAVKSVVGWTNGIKTIRSSLAFLVSIVHDLGRGAEWRSLYRIRTIFILAERSSGKMFLWGDKTKGIQVPVRVQPSVPTGRPSCCHSNDSFFKSWKILDWIFTINIYFTLGYYCKRRFKSM